MHHQLPVNKSISRTLVEMHDTFMYAPTATTPASKHSCLHYSPTDLLSFCAADLCTLFQLTSVADLRWSHAANTLDALHTAANTHCHAIEADVNYDHTAHRPIMAHDSNTPGTDVTPWLSLLFQLSAPTPPTASSHSQHALLKLDFKSLHAVSPTLATLTNRLHATPSHPAAHAAPSTVNPLLWLNADILQGPHGPPSSIDPEAFLSQCRQWQPNAVLSIGWTTAAPFTAATADHTYTAHHIDSMLSLCQRHSLTAVTFPMRACYVRRAWEDGQVQRLLKACDGYSLTVWSNRRENDARDESVVVAEYEWLRAHLPADRVFFDLCPVRADAEH